MTEVINVLRLNLFKNPKDYIEAVRPFLEKREEENGLFLGNLAMLETNSALTAQFMAEMKSDRETAFAALYREINLIVSRGPKECVEPVANKLKEMNIEIPGVVGPSEQAEWMALAWGKIRGCTSFLAMDQLIYKLTRVDWPTGIPGRMRPASSTDLDVLTDWIYGFHTEALLHEPFTREQARENADRRIPAGMTFIWEVNDVPVAMAALARPSAKGITVNAVFTPVGQRRKGYATALVAAVSAEGLRRGKEFCTLYTDLTNPTSNAIYQKVGYRPVCGSRNYRFHYGRLHTK